MNKKPNINITYHSGEYKRENEYVGNIPEVYVRRTGSYEHEDNVSSERLSVSDNDKSVQKN